MTSCSTSCFPATWYKAHLRNFYIPLFRKHRHNSLRWLVVKSCWQQSFHCVFQPPPRACCHVASLSGEGLEDVDVHCLQHGFRQHFFRLGCLIDFTTNFKKKKNPQELYGIKTWVNQRIFSVFWRRREWLQNCGVNISRLVQGWGAWMKGSFQLCGFILCLFIFLSHPGS